MRTRIALGVLAVVVLAAWAVRGRPLAQSPAAPASGADQSIIIELGFRDDSPRSWDGSIEAVGGEVVNLRLLRPRPGDAVRSKTSWTASTRQMPVFARRAWEEVQVEPPEPRMFNPALVVDLRNTRGIKLETAAGSFEVVLDRLEKYGREAKRPGPAPQEQFDAGVWVRPSPTADLLSAPDYQNDFPSLAAGANGELWAAWIGYRNGADTILARRFDGRSWSAVQTISEKPGDFFLVKLARDGQGKLWAVWSAQVEGNWDLYGRRFDGRSWSATARLTEDPQPDIYHNLVSDSTGRLWLVWQGFRNGRSDIFARRLEGSSWSPPERVSTSPANDWEPAVAACPGRVYVAWDTYDRGDYDVVMRSYDLASRRWSAVVPVSATPKFEAHASVACAADDSPWFAWNESGAHWGKDTGFLARSSDGTRLYQSRSIGLTVYQNGNWTRPIYRDLADYHDLPQLLNTKSGMWLFYRERRLRIPDVPSDAPAHRAAWEIKGHHFDTGIDMMIPFSQGRTDMHIGLATDTAGNPYMAWPTDNRDYEEFLFEHADVYAAQIPTPASVGGEPAIQPFRPPEIKTFPVHEGEVQDLAAIRGYAIQSGGKTYHIYRGDTHRHTEFSMDGNNDGSLLDTYRYAIDAAQLDFLGVSEHNGLGGPDVEYIRWLTQKTADLFFTPGTFTPLHVYERSVSYPNGHRNVIFARRGVPTLPIPPEEQKAQTGAQALYEYLKRNRGIAISHTSASTMGTDWRDNDPEVEPLVEIYQGDRVSAEYEGAPKAANAKEPSSAPGGFRPLGYVWNAWKKGYKLGVQVSSDHLSTHISYACTIAAGSTREGLLDAMRQRHSYGATDNIILDYRMETGGQEYLQGDIVPVSGPFRFTVKVIGTAPIRQIDVLKNNAFVHNLQPMQREVSFAYVDNQPSAGESYYYVRVIQANDQMAWSSPIWVKR